jgi:hypothetical protein
MIILNGPQDTHLIPPPYDKVRDLAEQRFREILGDDEAWSVEELGFMVVIEPGDTSSDLTARIKWDILSCHTDDSKFGEEGFSPGLEAMDDHGFCFELVQIFDDSGRGCEIFVPKDVEGIDPWLLQFCKAFSTPTSHPLDPPSGD